MKDKEFIEIMLKCLTRQLKEECKKLPLNRDHEKIKKIGAKIEALAWVLTPGGYSGSMLLNDTLPLLYLIPYKHKNGN